MSTELVTEQFIYQGEDIVTLKHDYLPNTLVGYYLSNGLKVNLDIDSIGDKYININKNNLDIPLKTSISITYRVEKDISKYSLGERIKVLEATVYKQQERLNILEEALKHRLDINTFKTYLKSLEKKLNVDLIDNSYSPPYP